LADYSPLTVACQQIPPLPFLKSTAHRHLYRLEQILQNRFLAGDDIRLHRHAGHNEVMLGIITEVILGKLDSAFVIHTPILAGISLR
jgi:hypothetical protein